MLDAFEIFKENPKQIQASFGRSQCGKCRFLDQIESLKCKNDIVFTNRVSAKYLQMVLASSEALMLVSFLEGVRDSNC